jgi:hypothetical protein
MGRILIWWIILGRVIRDLLWTTLRGVSCWIGVSFREDRWERRLGGRGEVEWMIQE